MQVLITVDTEVWCGGWKNLDERFPAAFRRYVYGDTKHGQYALPAMLEILNEFGLKATFFVEPLFSLRFGRQYLEEIVALLQAAGQDVQLHMHTEWVDEIEHPSIPKVAHKMQHLRYFPLDQQIQLLSTGLQLLSAAGAQSVRAFRAGNYGFNADTLRALKTVGIDFDSSYNRSGTIGVADVEAGRTLDQPVKLHEVFEYPVTVFADGLGLRQLLFTANSFAEMERVLWEARESGWQCVVLVTHNFELLNSKMTERDSIAVARFRKFCEFLARHEQHFAVVPFGNLPFPTRVEGEAPLLRSSLPLTAGRYVEQGLRRLLY